MIAFARYRFPVLVGAFAAAYFALAVCERWLS